MFKIIIDNKVYDVAEPLMTGQGILEIAYSSFKGYELCMKTPGNTMRKIAHDEIIDLSLPGLEHFITIAKAHDNELDSKKPHSKKYKVKIDKNEYEVDHPLITGRELLELAKKIPYTKYGISKRIKGNKYIPIEYDENVDLSEPGIEKFVTLPYEHTDGEEPERAFSFNEEDTFFLDSLNLPYEAVSDGNTHWLLIHNFNIPEGYNTDSATAAIIIPSGYPDTSLDMVYFNPSLSLNNGQQIPATQCQVLIRGLSFQRWSRHFTAQNPWRPGIDNLNTFYLYIQNWLKRELKK